MMAILRETWDQLTHIGPYMVSILSVLITLLASGHAIIYKRDTRAAVAWVGLIWLVPFVGALLYVLLGVNRIKRRAKALRAGTPHLEPSPALFVCSDSQLPEMLGPESIHLAALARITASASGRPLLRGNRITPLKNGDEAYPDMIRIIDEAQDTILFSTYILDNDRAGKMFLEAFQRAVNRRVEVRVLIDDVGARYSWPSMVGALRQAGVQVARFLPTLLPGVLRFSNLRNHRKILTADGRVGFTGGMNIREGCCLEWNPRKPVQDVHFRVEGPVVTQLQEILAEDWAFCTGELLQGERWFPPVEPVGNALARGISDGPDEDFEKLRLTLLGALTCARSSVCLVTPYFLPDDALITTLNMAAMRGVEVDILLPEKNNLPPVKWASTALLWQVLQRGCRVWMTPPPFDHSKLLIVDGIWSFFGSSNWDPRSLRLNFEFDLECYDRELGSKLEELFQEKRRAARPVTLADVDGRSLPIRLRDGIARLFSPYM